MNRRQFLAGAAGLSVMANVRPQVIPRVENVIVNPYRFGGSLFQGLRFTLSPTTSNYSLSLPCNDDGVFDATINWGDGTGTQTVTAYNSANLSHTYATAGDYTVEIVGDFPNIVFYGDGASPILTNIEETSHVFSGSMTNSFRNCSELITFPGSFDLTNVTDVNHMFRDCLNLTTVPAMDLAETTKINNMFMDCDSITTWGGVINVPKCLEAKYVVNNSEMSSAPPFKFRDLSTAYYGFRSADWSYFYPNVFDDCWKSINWSNSFNVNSNASEEALENILVSLSVMPGRTAANAIELTGAPALSVIQANPTITTAVNELKANGWTVYYNGTTL